LIFTYKIGKGTYFYAKDGSVYEGEWENDTRSGYGTYSVQDIDDDGRPLGLRKVYAGEWANDYYSGKGMAFYFDGSSYEGVWSDNRPNGWGTMTYPDKKRCASLID
jgi:hypothetical protein